MQRFLTGEKTVAELDIAPSVIRNWARRSGAGATTAVAANDHVVPAGQRRDAYGRTREGEQLLGRKQMGIGILEAIRDVLKKSLVARIVNMNARGQRPPRPWDASP